MCGIVGILSYKDHIPPGVLESATLSLAHRGPDDSGTVKLKAGALEIGLGHRRLSILDLSPLGHQPMQDPVTGSWIVYNGEIYNFRDLRRELEAEGVQFRGHSDTEVILAAYRVWGESGIVRLHGMFAFALCDPAAKRLLLARDPMGIKPLYYYHSNQHFIFASEVRTILGTGLIPRRPDPAGVFSYLAFGSVAEPWTFVEGVRAVPPGYLLAVDQGHLSSREYCHPLPSRLAANSEIASLNAKETTDQLSAILRDAVLSHLVSDVPVGVFLSGGIDSSALVAILSRNGVRARTFSLVFDEPKNDQKKDEFNEAEYSRIVAHHFGTEHQEIAVSERDALAILPEALRAMDQPTIDGINTYLVSARTRAVGVPVALSGLGADEIFAGYSNFRRVPRMEKFVRGFARLPHFARAAVVSWVELFAANSDRRRKFTEMTANEESIFHPYFLARMLFGLDEREALFPASAGSDAQLALQHALGTALADSQFLDPINRVSYLEATFYMRNTLLRDSDCMSMAHGLELRVPFLDRALVEACFRIPGPQKLRGKSPKSLLQASLGVALPQKIVNRPKRGFTLPWERWLRGEMRPLMEETLLSRDWEQLSISPEAVWEIWRHFLAGKTSWSRPWSLFVLKRWLQQNL